MHSHIQYENGQQYHAELLRKAAQSQLAGAAGKRENRGINKKNGTRIART